MCISRYSGVLVLILASLGCGQNSGFELGAALINIANRSALQGSQGDVEGQVFIKNPVATAGSNVGYNINFSTGQVQNPTPKNFDSYLRTVNVTGTKNGYLENADIAVKTNYVTSNTIRSTNIQRARPVDGAWFFSSVNDPDHKLGQVMAYYWINHEKDKANGLLQNSWHPTGKNISVYSYCYDATDNDLGQQVGVNAFWTGLDSNFTCLSYSGPFESAYDATVYLHEMGHANIDYATNGQISADGVSSTSCSLRDSNGNVLKDSAGNPITFPCCPSATGCSLAINEGQADYHSFFVFDSGSLGEFFINNTTGLSPRNAELNTSGTILTAQALYNGTAAVLGTDPINKQLGKEVHSMGGVWGSAWWNLRKAANLGSTVSDQIFLKHLSMLTASDTFSTALNVILAADQTLVNEGVFSANHRTKILAVFAQHGITPQ